ncbi:MAG: hypothetical protein ACP5N2_03075 [Candidatus Nanoarchaeia archaeon]
MNIITDNASSSDMRIEDKNEDLGGDGYGRLLFDEEIHEERIR